MQYSQVGYSFALKVGLWNCFIMLNCSVVDHTNSKRYLYLIILIILQCCFVLKSLHNKFPQEQHRYPKRLEHSSGTGVSVSFASCWSITTFLTSSWRMILAWVQHGHNLKNLLLKSSILFCCYRWSRKAHYLWASFCWNRTSSRLQLFCHVNATQPILLVVQWINCVQHVSVCN